MQRIIAILMCFTILITSSGSLAVVAAYQFNKDYITSYFCENLPKGDTECSGKCHLKKELKKEDEKEKSQTNPVKEKNEIQYFQKQLSAHFTGTDFSSGFEINHYIFNIHSAPPAEILQPPKV